MIGQIIRLAVAIVGVLVLWVVCLRMLLGAAGHGDPGAYLMVAGVFLLLPFAAVVFIVAITRERSGTWDRPRGDLLPTPQRAELAPAPQATQLETSWSAPRLIAREVTVTRELYQ